MRLEYRSGPMAGVLLLFVAMVVAGCSGGWYASKFAKPEGRIPFREAGVQQTGVWGTGDLSIAYRYTLGDSAVNFAGEVTLERRVSEFNSLRYLVCRVHFLNGEGRILDSRVLLSTAHREWLPHARTSFDRKLALPDGAVAFAFSYDGAAGDGGGASSSGGLRGGGSDWEFWSLP